jgi:hypothetical protein
LRRFCATLSLLATLVILVGCAESPGGGGGSGGKGTSSSSEMTTGEGGFISGLPSTASSRPIDDGTSSVAVGTTAATGGPYAIDTPGDLTPAGVDLADRQVVVGGHVAAISSLDGLSILDTNGASPVVLAQRKFPGVPHAIFALPGAIAVVFSGWQTGDGLMGHVEVFDLQDPSAPARRGAGVDLKGYFVSAELAGGVLVTSSIDAKNCTQCPATSIATVDVTSAAGPSIVSEIRMQAASDPINHPIAVDPAHVVAATSFPTPLGATQLRLLDVGAGGTLTDAHQLQVTGHVDHRFQMDADGTTLRVVASPDGVNAPARLHAIALEGPSAGTALGTADVPLASGDDLDLVRFRGPFAFTTMKPSHAVRVFDFSDPTQPKAAGAVNVTFDVLEMIPLASSLLLVGSGDVALVDVSNPAQPSLKSHLPLAPGYFTPLMDPTLGFRSLAVDEAGGAVMVPLSYSASCPKLPQGLALFSLSAAGLTAASSIAIEKPILRATLGSGKLGLLTDDGYALYDVQNLATPAPIAARSLRTDSTGLVVAGSHVVRLAARYDEGHSRLEVLDAANVGAIDPIGSLDLAPVLAMASPGDCAAYPSNARLFAAGNTIALTWVASVGVGQGSEAVATFDISDPAHPALKGLLQTAVDWQLFPEGFPPQFDFSGGPVRQVGSSLVFLSIEYPKDSNNDYVRQPDPAVLRGASLTVVDLTPASGPAITKTLELPKAVEHAWLVTEGTEALLSHYLPVAGDPHHVKFFVNRLDLASPAAPVLDPPVNVPGALVDARPDGEITTVDFEDLFLHDVLWPDCLAQFGPTAVAVPQVDANKQFDWSKPVVECSVVRRKLKRGHLSGGAYAQESESPLDNNEIAFQYFPTDTALFVSGAVMGAPTGPAPAVTRVDASGGVLQATTFPVPQPLTIPVSGTKLVTWDLPLGDLHVIDMTDPSAPVVTKRTFPVHTDQGFYAATVVNDQLVFSLGSYGVAAISL